MLGKQCKDKITGFSGIAIGKAEYLFGCTQFLLAPEVGEDGKRREGEWFDSGRLVVTGHGVTAEDVAGEKPGGPQTDRPKTRA